MALQAVPIKLNGTLSGSFLTMVAPVTSVAVGTILVADPEPAKYSEVTPDNIRGRQTLTEPCISGRIKTRLYNIALLSDL